MARTTEYGNEHVQVSYYWMRQKKRASFPCRVFIEYGEFFRREQTRKLCYCEFYGLFIDRLACVASVSARVRRESWEESKKRNDGGGGGERRNRLPANPTILKNCVRPRTQLLIGAVLVVLIA